MTKRKPPALKVNMRRRVRPGGKPPSAFKVGRATPETVKIGRDGEGRGRVRKMMEVVSE